MSVLDNCFARIRGRGLRVVFPEGEDERIVAAARRLRDEGLAEPILLRHPEASDRHLRACAASVSVIIALSTKACCWCSSCELPIAATSIVEGC